MNFRINSHMFVGFQIFANLSNSIWSQCQFPRVAESRIVDVTGQPNALRTGNFGLKDSTVFRGIKAQAKKKISPAGVALSMVPNPRHIITDCYISTSVKESNLANEKYQTAEIKGRRHHVFNTFASNVFHPSNRVAAVRLPISKQRVHLVRMHQAWTHYIHHITTWSLRCQIMFMSSHVRILKLSGVDPHRLCRPLSHVGWCLSICRYGTAGLIGNKSRLTTHFKSFQATQYSPCLKCFISNPVDTKSTGSLMKA